MKSCEVSCWKVKIFKCVGESHASPLLFQEIWNGKFLNGFLPRIEERKTKWEPGMDKFHALLLIIARVESLSDKKSKVVGSFNLRFLELWPLVWKLNGGVGHGDLLFGAFTYSSSAIIIALLLAYILCLSRCFYMLIRASGIFSLYWFCILSQLSFRVCIIGRLIS